MIIIRGKSIDIEWSCEIEQNDVKYYFVISFLIHFNLR